MPLKPYCELRKLDISEYVEKRDGMDYLNWAKCKELLHENGADTVYFEPIVNSSGSSLFMSDVVFTDKNGTTNRCYEVAVKIVIDDKEFVMRTPLMNGSNPVKDNSMSQQRIWNAQARAFVKGVAIHTGLGFGLWLDDVEGKASRELDENEHDIRVIKKRIEKIYAKAVQYYGDEAILLKNLNSKKNNIAALLANLETVYKLEQLLKTIAR